MIKLNNMSVKYYYWKHCGFRIGITENDLKNHEENNIKIKCKFCGEIISRKEFTMAMFNFVSSRLSGKKIRIFKIK